MAKQESIVKEFLKYLKNNKGQGIVEFAAVTFFCIVVGLAARETGLLDALTDTYSDKVQIALGPSGITAGETNNGNNNTNTGNNTNNGNNNTNTGNNTNSENNNTNTGNNTNNENNNTNTGNNTNNENNNTNTGNNTNNENNNTNSETGSTTGMPVGGQTGEESGKLSPFAYYEKLLKYNQLYNTAQAIDKNDIIWNAYNESDRAVLNLDRDTLFQILLNEWPKICPGDNVKWTDLDWNNWKLLNNLDCTNVWVNMLKPKCGNGNLSPKQVWEKLNVYHGMLDTVQSKSKEDVVWEEYLNNDYSIMKLDKEALEKYARDCLPPTSGYNFNLSNNFKWEDINDQSPWQWNDLKRIYYNSGN